MSSFEHRTFLEAVEFRGDPGHIVAAGVAMRYGAKSKPIGGQFREVFTARSLTKTISEQDILACDEHDERRYLGRSSVGTLRLIDDEDALRYEIDIPDTMVGRDVATLMERGDLRGCSVAFRAIRGKVDWAKDDDGMALRTVREARLRHIATTVTPAYSDSTADLALRSLAEARNIDVAEVMAAAERGALGALIADESPEDHEGEDGRETPTLLRPHLGWLSA